MIDWQPIETAPKDRRVLLFRPAGPSWSRVACGKFDFQRTHNRPRPYWTSDLEVLLGVTACRGNPPTHWAELTEPGE